MTLPSLTQPVWLIRDAVLYATCNDINLAISRAPGTVFWMVSASRDGEPLNWEDEG